MTKKINQFEDLEVWQKAADIVVEIFKLCESGKLAKDFGSKDQIKRAAFSISNNISEGFEYNNNKQFVRFLGYAKGSCGEMRNQIIILKRVEYISEETYLKIHPQLISLSQQISNFMKYLKKFEIEKKERKK